MATFHEKIQIYMPYLEEIRRRLFSSTLLFCIVFIIGFFSTGFILKFLVNTFAIGGVIIATTSPFQFADLAMDVGFFMALLVTLPVLIYHLFSFTANALTIKEKRWFLVCIPISVLLFIIGFFYGFLVLYYSFSLLARLNESFGIQNIWNISSFLSQLFLTSSLLGLVFQFPLVLTILVRMGVLQVNFLREKRRIALFCILVLTSLLPPTDGLSLAAMVVPLLVLYEGTILINFKTKPCLD